MVKSPIRKRTGVHEIYNFVWLSYLNRRCIRTVKDAPIIIGALRKPIIGIDKFLKEIRIETSLEFLQKVCHQGTERIFRRV